MDFLPFAPFSFNSCVIFQDSYAVNILLLGDVVCGMTSNQCGGEDVFWDLTLCCWVSCSQHFEGLWSFNIYG